MNDFRIVRLRLRFRAEKKFRRSEDRGERLAYAAFEGSVVLRELHQAIERCGIDRATKSACCDALHDFARVSATSCCVRGCISLEEDFTVRLRIFVEFIAERADQLHSWPQFKRLQFAFGIRPG